MAEVDESILFVNNLTYSLPSASSVCTNRVTKRSYFQNRTYGSQSTMICQFNTGTDFINTKNSKLVLKVRALGATMAGNSGSNFGSGSGMNFVKNIRIYHRSGTTYTNTTRMNLYRSKVDHVKESLTWFNSIGIPLMGYKGGIDFEINAASAIDTRTQYIEIPLNKVHSFWEGHGDVMLPPQIASGLRVEIDLENALTVFTKNPTNVGYFADYEIQDCYMDLESYSLMDSASASINTQASTQSLEYLYTDVFTSVNSTPALTTQVNIDINKSVSLADSHITCILPVANINLGTGDSFSTPYLEGSWWTLLGSQQYPLQRIDNAKSAYHQALLTFDKFSHPGNDSALLYGNNLTPGFLGAYGIYGQSLERDTSLALSASPVNASRSLRFELTFDVPPVGANLVVVFLQYLSSSQSTLLNSRVDI